MGRRLPNPFRVKRHLNYTIEDIRRLLGVHPNTVRNWIRSGLPVVDGRRPVLIIGEHLILFLHQLHQGNKSPCGPGRLFCMRCRTPRVPLDESIRLHLVSPHAGNVSGYCPICGTAMNRRVNLANLLLATGTLRILPAPLLTINPLNVSGRDLSSGRTIL